MATRSEYSARPNRESLRKRLGRRADAIFARDGHACTYCGATAASSGQPLQLDHLTPRSLGGSDDPTNLIVACKPCNAARHALSLGEWLRRSGSVLTARQVRGLARRRLPVAA